MDLLGLNIRKLRFNFAPLTNILCRKASYDLDT